MIKTLAFRTQARTIDHLGREQIADCPTAISELWKNAYDAYARSASLHIFDGKTPVAAIYDDGHGMNYDEFVNRWLVIGTESKYDKQATKESDRNGLDPRAKQGQKGIGRLSSANLGPLLLVVSKRKDNDFIAALIDWRIFENPYLILSDIEIPVTTFKKQEDLVSLLPEMFERLTDNVWGSDSNADRKKRLEAAWNAFDELAKLENATEEKPSHAIVNTLINARFDDRHLKEWAVWKGEKKQGTALLVSDINFDLRAQLPNIQEDGTIENIRERFFKTLSAFTDPLVDKENDEENAINPNFEYEVRIWSGSSSKKPIENDGAYNRLVTDEMEHVLEGTIDKDGIFKGQIKAFGEWRELGSDYIIRPPKDFKLPLGPNTFVGPISFYLATYERNRLNSTHTDLDHARFDDLAKKHGTFLIFRDGLRVLPYGRVDNDFFEIEMRRSVSIGREFWNARRMFGRLAISREKNPNLRDKAGREGFIDNRAAKALKVLVINILRTSAQQFFGQTSSLRQPALSEIREVNLTAKADRERKELTKKNRKKFRTRLKKNLPLINEHYHLIAATREDLSISTLAEIDETQTLVAEQREELIELKITGAPRPLGTAEEDYRLFRVLYEQSDEILKEISNEITLAIEEIKPAKPAEILEKQLQRFAGQIHSRTRRWRRDIDELQNHEKDRISALFAERNQMLHDYALPLMDRLKAGEIELNYALGKLEQQRYEIDETNEEIFEAYIAALTLLKENVDIELIASQGTADNNDLKDQINRLNQLAQLGITVEILGHELNTYDQMISSGLGRISSLETSEATDAIRVGYEGLSRQLEFLSPLKLSGQRTSSTITGEDIFQYCEDFFANLLKSRGIKFETTTEFRSLILNEQPSRLFPVFINLINNSIYWLVTSKTEEPTIKFSIIDKKVIVSDNGPGVDSLDIPQLFQMFFSRKISGGRGIGLYLCRVNLLAGGHHIEYASTTPFKLLSGANFVIDFKGISFE